MTQQSRRNITIIGISLIISIPCGMLFSFIFSGQIFTGLFIASFISIVVSTMELFVFRSKQVRKLRPPVFFLINFIFYIVILMLPIIAVYTIGLKVPIQKLMASNIYWYGVIFGIILTFIFLFIRNVNALIGPGILIHLIMGRYFHPREEHRVFMFLDLNSSTAIAERIGHLSFHSLLSEFFFDISAPIQSYRGEIYKYVGDEIIVTWNVKNGTDNAACLRCFFDIYDTIDALRESYTERYGACPEFKAGMHVGPVTVGEMGFIKREIAFLGDTVNTTARIIGEAGSRKTPLMISRDLMDIITLPEEMTAAGTGSIILKGKKIAMDLFSIERRKS